MGVVELYERRAKKSIENLSNSERPKPEPETVGTWKGYKHSHIILDGSTCEILDENQWTIIQNKISELQDLIKVNIMASFFHIDGTLNKENG